MDARNVEQQTIAFLEENLQKYPGKSTLKVVISEPKNGLKIALSTIASGIEVNHELIAFLADKPQIDVQVAVG